MKCENCGAELEKDQSVCPNCSAQEQAAPVEAPVKKTRKQRKKEKIRAIVLSVVAGLLVVALTVGLILTGINDGWGRENNIYRKVSYGVSELRAQLSRNTVVATAGTYELTNGHLQVLYALNVLEYVDQFGEYISYSGIDITKPLSEQVYDKETGLTWEKYFLQEALSEWIQYCAMNKKAKENKFELPAEFSEHMATLEETIQKSASDDGFKSVNAMLQSDLGANVRYEDYYEYLTLYYVSNLYIEDLMEGIEVSGDDLEEYFAENESDLKNNYGVTKESGNFVDVQHILIMPEGGTTSEDGKTTTYSDAEWEECRVKAQAVYDEWLAGAMTSESFGELANEKSQDQDGQVTDGGLYENVSQGQMVEEFDAWCFDSARNPGDHGLVKTQYGYHVMYFVESEAIWVRYCRAGLQNQGVQKIMKEYMDKLEWEVDFTKIVLDNIELS